MAQTRVVPGEGLEPSRCRHRRILSPLRLPFRHPGVARSCWPRVAARLSRICGRASGRERRSMPVSRTSVPWIGLQPCGSGFSPVGRASARRVAGICRGSGFSPTGFVPVRSKCVGLKADPQLFGRGSGFSPTGCGDMPWVGLQPDGVRAGAKQMRRPEGRPTKNGPRRSMRRPGIAGASVLCRLTSVF